MMDFVLNATLSLVMFGLGLKINTQTLKSQFTKPKALTLGLCIQIFITPIIAFLIVHHLNLNNVYALGLMLVSAVPGGTTSGIITYWAKGDVALSVTLTSLSGILVTFFTLPLILLNSYTLFPIEKTAGAINTTQMMLKLFLVVIVPIFIALIIKPYIKNVKDKIDLFFNRYMIAYYVIMIIAGIIIVFKESDKLFNNWKSIALACLILNIVMFGIGMLLSKFFRINNTKTKTIAIESAFQNNNLALAIALSLIGIDAVALPSIVYGVIMTLTGLSLVLISKKYIGNKKTT